MKNVVQKSFFLKDVCDNRVKFDIIKRDPMKKNSTSRIPQTNQIKSIWNSKNHTDTISKVAKYKTTALLVKYLGK